MPHLPSLPDDAILTTVFKTYPKVCAPLVRLADQVMHGPAPFSIAEREMIAAYASGLNACQYCHGVHEQVADEFGMEAGLMPKLLDDLETAPVAEKLKPVLRYARQLTLEPAKATKAQVDAIYAAGWDEDAVFFAVMVTALFNFMNRMVEGIGIHGTHDYFVSTRQAFRERGYRGLAAMIEALAAERGAA